MKSGAVHGIILTTPILYLTGCPHRLAAKGRQPPGTGNYTIHALRSWYNNRKALIIPALCPHAAGAAGRAIIPFTLRVHGIITAKRLLYLPHASTPRSGGLGNYTIRALHSWYNIDYANIILDRMPSPARRQKAATAGNGQLYHSRSAFMV